MLKKVISILFTFALLLTLFTATGFSYDNSDTKSNNNPLYQNKEVLNYLLWTVDAKLENDAVLLQKELGLTDEQMDQLRDWGIKERQLVIEELSKYTEQQLQDADLFNATAAKVFAARNEALQGILGKKYSSFADWIAKWWENEKVYRNKWIKERQSLNADIDRVSGIFATQYNPNKPGAYEVALPDKYVKFANLGWTSDIPANLRPIYSNAPYRVNVYNPSKNRAVNGVRVDEVGPWNTDDNYWDAKNGNNPRRRFTDLALGTPESYAAYTNGYNGGKDQSGRTVLNPAGIDLTPNVAADLGLSLYQNAWVDVRYEFLP